MEGKTVKNPNQGKCTQVQGNLPRTKCYCFHLEFGAGHSPHVAFQNCLVNWIQAFAQISTGLPLFPQSGTHSPHDKCVLT